MTGTEATRLAALALAAFAALAAACAPGAPAAAPSYCAPYADLEQARRDIARIEVRYESTGDLTGLEEAMGRQAAAAGKVWETAPEHYNWADVAARCGGPAPAPPPTAAPAPPPTAEAIAECGRATAAVAAQTEAHEAHIERFGAFLDAGGTAENPAGLQRLWDESARFFEEIIDVAAGGESACAAAEMWADAVAMRVRRDAAAEGWADALATCRRDLATILDC